MGGQIGSKYPYVGAEKLPARAERHYKTVAALADYVATLDPDALRVALELLHARVAVLEDLAEHGK